MKTYNNLYERLCSCENLRLAFAKARKRKTLKPYVQDFEANLEENLKGIQIELQTQTYKPAPLTTFIVRDPKTRLEGWIAYAKFASTFRLRKRVEEYLWAR